MNAILSQFRGLRVNDPGSWPPAPKLFVLLLILVVGVIAAWWLDWSGELTELQSGRDLEVTLKNQYVTKYGQAVNLDLYRAQLQKVNVEIGQMLRQLPNRAQMETLIKDINQAGIGRGLQFDLFKPAQQETKHDVYAELPISIQVVGTYHAMGAFAEDIAKLSRIVTLNNLVLTVSKQGQLVLDATAKTYRYLDEHEQEADRKAESAKHRIKTGHPA